MREITSKLLKEHWANSTFDHSKENGNREFDIDGIKFTIHYDYDWKMYGVFKNNSVQIAIQGRVHKVDRFIYNEDISDLFFDDMRLLGSSNNVNNFHPPEEQRSLFKKYVQINPELQLREHEFSLRFQGWIAAYSGKRQDGRLIQLNEHWDDMRVGYMLNLRLCQKRFWWALFDEWCERSCKGKIYLKGDMLIFEDSRDAVMFKMTYDLKVP